MISPSVVVTHDAQNEEKMETNEETAPVTEESVITQENIEARNSEPTVDPQVTEQGQETVQETKTTQDEVETAVNEQELKYWNAVNDNPQDFTSWTYLLQFVEQEVGKYV